MRASGAIRTPDFFGNATSAVRLKMMNSTRWLGAALVIVLAGFGLVVWRQQQVINSMSAGAAGVQTPLPDQTADIGKITPALSNVTFDVTIAGAPAQGAAGTNAVFLEFSDFQCPFCARYERDVYPRILREYVQTGKVRYVFRQLPLESLHPDAMSAAIVASCAAAQGKFWEVRERLFAHQDQLALPAVLEYTKGLGMDDAGLQACVSQQQPTAEIAASRSDAVRAGFTGTPGFLVGTAGADGVLHAVRRLYGAQPYSLFQSAIDDVLAGKK
jgi:protein-disulfide isomerase